MLNADRLALGSIFTQRKKINYGEVYVLDTEGFGSVIKPTRQASWVPKTGFGFLNSITAAPVLMLGDPRDPNVPPRVALDPQQPLWVPGAGTIEAPDPGSPDRELAVWFESRSKSGARTTTADQSRTGVLRWSDDDDDVEEDDDGFQLLKLIYLENGEFITDPESKKGNDSGLPNGGEKANDDKHGDTTVDAHDTSGGTGGDVHHAVDEGNSRSVSGSGLKGRMQQAPPSSKMSVTMRSNGALV